MRAILEFVAKYLLADLREKQNFIYDIVDWKEDDCLSSNSVEVSKNWPNMKISAIEEPTREIRRRARNFSESKKKAFISEKYGFQNRSQSLRVWSSASHDKRLG